VLSDQEIKSLKEENSLSEQKFKEFKRETKEGFVKLRQEFFKEQTETESTEIKFSV